MASSQEIRSGSETYSFSYDENLLQFETSNSHSQARDLSNSMATSFWSKTSSIHNPLKKILAESHMDIYYLKHRKTVNTDALEREARRVDFLCRRDATRRESAKSKSKKFDFRTIFHGRDKLIEEEMFAKYKDEEVRNNLFGKVAALKREVKLQRRIEKDVREVVNADEKSVLDPDPDDPLIITFDEDDNAESLQLSSNFDQKELKADALKTWLSIICATSSIRCFARTVGNAKLEVEAKKSMVNLCVERFINKLRSARGMPRFNTDKRKLLNRRSMACGVLVTHLRERMMMGPWRVIAKQYKDKVINLQRIIRRHLASNKARIAILAAFFDRFVAAFMRHVLVIYTTGNGLDEVTRGTEKAQRIEVKRRIRTSDKLRLIQAMSTAAYHAKLRAAPLVTIVGEFLSKNAHKPIDYLLDEKICRKLFERIVFEKRRAWTEKRTRTLLKADIPVPDFSLEDANAYISLNSRFSQSKDIISQLVDSFLQNDEERALRRVQLRTKKSFSYADELAMFSDMIRGLTLEEVTEAALEILDSTAALREQQEIERLNVSRGTSADASLQQQASNLSQPSAPRTPKPSVGFTRGAPPLAPSVSGANIEHRNISSR